MAVHETWTEFFLGKGGETGKVDPWAHGYADVMLVFPVQAPLNFSKPEKLLPTDHTDPNSAANMLRQIIVDEHLFDPSGRKFTVAEEMSANTQQDDVLDSFAGMFSAVGMAGDEEGDQELLDDEEAAGQNGGTNKRLEQTYARTRQCNTMRQFRVALVELVLDYLVSSHCGLSIRAFSSVDKDELFIAISAEEKILKAHAHQLQYKLQLDSALASELLDGSPKFEPEELSPPYIAYDMHMERAFERKHRGRTPFKLQTDVNPYGSIFRGVDRLRIVQSILDRAFRLGVMQDLALINVFFPCHNLLGEKTPATGMSLRRDPKLELSISWAALQKIWNPAIPSDEINDYFGEGHTFRMLQLSFLTKKMVPLGIAVVPILVLKYLTPLWRSVELVTATMLVLWTTFYHLDYLREEAYWCQRWGMDDFSKEEAKRPEFRETRWIRSPIDRRTLVKVDNHRVARRLMATAITLFFIFCSLMTTAGLYLFLHEREQQGKPAKIVTILIPLEIFIYKTLWYTVADWLTKFENWEMESEYFEALVYRIFYFQFINCFASPFYLGLFKNIGTSEGEHSDGEEALSAELSHQLRILFFTNVFNNIFTVVTPLFTYWYRTTFEDRKQAAGNGDETRQLVLGMPSSGDYSWQEKQAKLPPYILNDEIWERMDVIIDLGYVLFFGFCAPEIIFLFLLNNLIRIRALGWVLVNTYLRPFPRKASSFGQVFHEVYKFIFGVATVSNVLLLLVYNASNPDEKDDSFLWLKELLATRDEDVERMQDWRSILTVALVLIVCISVFSKWIRTLIPHDTKEAVLVRQRRELIMVKFTNSLSTVDDSQVLKRTYQDMHSDFKIVHTLRTGLWTPEEPRTVAPGTVPRWNDTLGDSGPDPWFLIPS